MTSCHRRSVLLFLGNFHRTVATYLNDFRLLSLQRSAHSRHSRFVCFQDAVRNAARLMCEGGCDAVKMEGGERVGPLIDSVIRAGIPVMGHLGLTPQTPSSIGGYTSFYFPSHLQEEISLINRNYLPLHSFFL